MKLLITGSRAWDRPDVVHHALDDRLAGLHAHRQQAYQDPGERMTVVWGRARQGADHAVTLWCQQHDQDTLDVEITPFDAQWNVCPGKPFCAIPPEIHQEKGYCPRAGHFRNQQMVDQLLPIKPMWQLADHGLVFLVDDIGEHVRSTGTRDCRNRLVVARIPYTQYLMGSDGQIHVTTWTPEQS